MMPSLAFKTSKSQREEKQKSIISEQLFSFLKFQTFGNLEIVFGINLNRC